MLFYAAMPDCWVRAVAGRGNLSSDTMWPNPGCQGCSMPHKCCHRFLVHQGRLVLPRPAGKASHLEAEAPQCSAQVCSIQGRTWEGLSMVVQTWQQCATFRTPAECPVGGDAPTCASVAEDLMLWPSCCL